jgi:hypothetical protein
LAGAQARLHAPQWVEELAVFTSQPLAALPSQSAKPAAHDATTHRPPAQALVALARAQRVPQAPQLVALVLSEVSQPLAALPSQSPKPASQAKVHARLAQRAAALAGTAQARPQVPQWATLVARSAQAPSQTVCPAGQFEAHTPALHTRPAAQRAPQAPQFAALLRVSASQPLAGLLSQSAKPGSQAKPQRPSAQVGRAFAGAEQAMPHMPQLVSSVRRSASQPLARSPSQLPKEV